MVSPSVTAPPRSMVTPSGSRDRIAEGANSLDFDTYHLPGQHGPHPRGRTGQDHIAWQQGGVRGDVGHQLWDGEDHVFGIAVLTQLTIQGGANREGGNLLEPLMRGDPWPEWAERVVALGPGPLAIGALQVTGGDVVGDGVAEDHIWDAEIGTSLQMRPITTASSPS